MSVMEFKFAGSKVRGYVNDKAEFCFWDVLDMNVNGEAMMCAPGGKMGAKKLFKFVAANPEALVQEIGEMPFREFRKMLQGMGVKVHSWCSVD